jgi:hypothetical protein
VPVRAVWDEGRITVEVNGQRVTMHAENSQIEEIVKGERKVRKSEKRSATRKTVSADPSLTGNDLGWERPLPR